MLRKTKLSILIMVLLIGCYQNNEPNEVITESEEYTDIGFSGISFANEMVGYISTGCNISLNIAGILKTTDGGVTWQFYPVCIDTIPSTTIRSVYALSVDTVYATYSGFSNQEDYQGVCKSVNGGVTWTNLGNLISAGAYGSVYFRNSQIGFVCNGNEILKTEDGGNNWETKFDISGFGGIGQLNFTSRDIGYACQGFVDDYGSSGKLIKTTNGGDSWSELPSLKEYITCLKFVNNETGYAFSYNDNLYKTTNGGQSWAIHSKLPGGLYYSAVVIGSSQYFTAMNRIYRSTNDFINFNEIYSSKISNVEFSGETAHPSQNTSFFLTQHSIVKIIQH